MKKKLLFGFILCGITTVLSAQQKDTIMVQQLPKISRIIVQNNAHVIFKSGPQNEVFTTPNRNVEAEETVSKMGEIVNSNLVLNQPCVYHLTLADTAIRLDMRDSALATINDMKSFPFREIEMKGVSSLIVENKDSLVANRVNAAISQKAAMKVKSPLHIHRLNVMCLGTDAKYSVETEAYHVDYYNYQFAGKNDDTLDNTSFVKIMASSDGDTSVFVADKLDSKSDWENFFKELGGGLYELSNLWNDTPNKSEKKEAASISTPSEKKFKHWDNSMEFGWAFMYWNEDITSFSRKFSSLSVPSNEHITFSSLFLEMSESFLFNEHHTIKLGIGMAWDNYHFNNITVNSLINPTPDYAKAKYTIAYITVPLGYEYFGKHCGFSLKLIPGYAINTHVKMKNCIKDGNEKQIRKYKAQDWDYVNLFKLDARAELRIYDWGTLFVQPSLLPILNSNGEKKLYPIRFGYALQLDNFL